MNEPERLDLGKVAADDTASKSIPIGDFNRSYGINGCIVCGRGGHTRTTLLRVILSISTAEEGYACKEHSVKYLRPKDVKRK